MKKALLLAVVLALGMFAPVNGGAEAVGGDGIQAAMLEDVIVFRIPTELLDAMTPEPMQYGYDTVGILDMRDMLLSLLSEPRFDEFVGDYYAFGYAEATVREPSMETVENNETGLWMNARPTEDAWYFVYRPGSMPQGLFPIHLSLFEVRLSLLDGVLRYDILGRASDPDQSAVIQDAGDAECVFERKTDALEMRVYRVLGGNIAAIREAGSKHASAYSFLLIDDRQITHVSSEGYDGVAVIFYCALTDAELEALQDGADAAILANYEIPR